MIYEYGYLFIIVFQFIAYRHIMFREQPVIPLITLFHDSKMERSHYRFIEILHQEIPEINDKCVMITDGEAALKNAFRFYYPQVQHFRCWNHLGQNLKAAARINFPFEQIAEIIEQDPTIISTTKREVVASLTESVKDLLRSKSRTDFDNLYKEASLKWPPKFRQYFNKYLLPTIDEMGE